MASRFKRGFTLMELLIVVALLAILLIAILISLNARGQIEKANDARRKRDLATLQRALEDWYNDKGCFPMAHEICYDTPLNVCRAVKTVSSRICHVCGTANGSPSFSPYLTKLPCDPEHPNHKYLYEVEVQPSSLCTGNFCNTQVCSTNYCPQWYRVYTDFDIGTGQQFDKDSIAVGCTKDGCGPSADAANKSGGVFLPFGYDWGISSTNKSLETSETYVCVDSSNRCQVCPSPGDYDSCYNNAGCTDKNRIYASAYACLHSSPPPIN